MKRNRYFCWDLSEVEKHEGITLVAHKPQKRNLALICDAEWEGVHNGYGSLVRVGETYRLYYRADASRCLTDGTLSRGKGQKAKNIGCQSIETYLMIHDPRLISVP